MWVRIGAVMGSVTLGVAWQESLARLIPAKAFFSIGREDWSWGSAGRVAHCAWPRGRALLFEETGPRL